MKINTTVMLVLMVFVGTMFAATTQATVQITDYAITPSTIYPGTDGTLQLTLANAGTVAADAVTIYSDNGPNLDGSTTTTINGIGAGSNTLITIPFSVPENVASGILQIHLNIYYNYEGNQGTNTGSYKTTISLPVSQRQSMEVNTISINGTALVPGDKFGTTLQITNNGGAVTNAIVRYANGSVFTLDGSSQKNIGNLAYNSTKTVYLDLRSASTAQPGKYMIPMIMEYQDTLQNTVTQTFYIGPVSIADQSAQFKIQLTPLTSTEIGSDAKFQLSLENRGNSETSIIVILNQTSVFTPLGNNRIYLDGIKPGETRIVELNIGIGAASSGGYYLLPVTIESDGKTNVNNIGIEVLASQDVTISTKTESGTVSAQIANTGNSPIRSVYVQALGNKNVMISGTSDKFIGTLNVDDYSTFTFTVNTAGRQQNGTTPFVEATVPIKITYKDSFNKEHVIERDVSITANTGTTNVPVGTRKGTDAIGLPVIVGALAILAVAGYFIYKKYFGVKKV